MKTPEYTCWSNMKRRCYNPNNHNYVHYGGRGITVCDEWLHDFVAFHNYIGDKPSSKHSLDRIDNDGNYEPSNVRWATYKEQANNRRDKRRYELTKLYKTNKSGVRGVSWHKHIGKWRIQETINHKQYTIGYFDDILDAIKMCKMRGCNG